MGPILKTQRDTALPMLSDFSEPYPTNAKWHLDLRRSVPSETGRRPEPTVFSARREESSAQGAHLKRTWGWSQGVTLSANGL